jgi:RNA polymerase sigma factor (sigma-70 family)
MMGVLDGLIGRLREVVAREESGALPDGELLRRWVQQRDQGAFELLVWRHGRLVLSVCRRLLGNGPDVEDAFQATFLVLVRKAGGISRGQALASWLHAVAYRIALQARARKGRNEPIASDHLDLIEAPCENEVEAREARAVIDEEVRRLPEKYRLPFVLCYLEGRTNEEAARELGRPVGTIASRLARARDRLHARLVRRGLTPSAGLLGPGLSSLLPGQLVGPTVHAALAVSARQTAEGVVSAPVIALMEGALRAMLYAKVKTVFAFVLSVAVLGVGGVAGYRTVSAQPGREGPGPGTRTVGSASPQNKIEQLKKQLDEAQARVKELQKALDDLVAATKAQPRSGMGGGFGSTGGGLGMGGFSGFGGGRGTGSMSGTSSAFGSSMGMAPRTRPRDEAEVMQARVDVKKAEMSIAKIAAERAKKRLARMRGLGANRAISADELDAAGADAETTNAQLQVKEAELRESTILLRQAQRRSAAMSGGSSTTSSTTTAPRTLEQRVADLERKLEVMEQKRQVERALKK